MSATWISEGDPLLGLFDVIFGFNWGPSWRSKSPGPQWEGAKQINIPSFCRNMLDKPGRKACCATMRRSHVIMSSIQNLFISGGDASRFAASFGCFKLRAKLGGIHFFDWQSSRDSSDFQDVLTWFWFWCFWWFQVKELLRYFQRVRNSIQCPGREYRLIALRHGVRSGGWVVEKQARELDGIGRCGSVPSRLWKFRKNSESISWVSKHAT